MTMFISPNVQNPLTMSDGNSALRDAYSQILK